MIRDIRAQDEARHWLKRAPLLTVIGAAALAAVAALGTPDIMLIACGLGLGALTLVLAVVSWCWYRFWYSWLLWAVPIAAGSGALLRVFGASGVLSVPSVFLQLMASVAVGFGLLLWLGRSWVQRALS
jgi:hypothetical protein